MARCEVIVDCTRCGEDYENPNVPNQFIADAELAVCDPCHEGISMEIEAEQRQERGILGAYGP
jgi:CRISPR/Cas system endoribonuclease Cas6 (RAMP superfamily)